MELKLNALSSAAWDEFVYATPQGTIFSTYEWININAAGGRPHFITWHDSAGLIAGTALVEKDGQVAPLPFSQYNPLLTVLKSRRLDEQDSLSLRIQNMLIDYVQAHFQAARFILHPAHNDIRAFQWCGWKERVKSTYYVDLRDMEQACQLYRPALRRQIKKKSRYGFESCVSDDIESLLFLAKQSFARQGARMFVSDELIKAVHARYAPEGKARLFLLLHRGEPVAANLFIMDRTGVAYYYTAGAHDEYLEKGAPSILLYDALVELARAAYHTMDFGGAHHPTIARFKAGFNPSLVTYFEVKYESQANPPGR